MGERTCSRACAFAAVCLALLPAGCGGKQAPAASPPPVVSVAAVTQNDVPIYSEYIGTLDGYVNADARARVQIEAPPSFRFAEGATSPSSIADLPWWEVFRDDALQTLLRRALVSNFDVRIAVARVEQSRAEARAAGRTFSPASQ